MYACVAPHLSGFNIFGIDLRSHGLSERGDVSKWEGFSRDVSAACEKILDFTNSEKLIGVGISSGASAHILNASNNEAFYEALVLFEPILFSPQDELAGREKLAESARNRRSTFSNRQEVFERFTNRGPFKNFSPSALALYAQYGFKESEDGVELACNKKDEETIYLSGSKNGVYDAMRALKIPSLIVTGEHSKHVSQQTLTEVSQQMRDANTTIMENVEHFTLFENPVLGAQIIDEYLKSTQ